MIKPINFTTEEINMLWDSEPNNDYISILLMLIYSGLRIDEFLNLKKEDVHIEEKWIYVRESKTSSGIRGIPIADKVLKFWTRWYDRQGDYLICTSSNEQMSYDDFCEKCWYPVMDEMKFSSKHIPHTTRSTCSSMLSHAGINNQITAKILGNAHTNSKDYFLDVNTPLLFEAINKM